MPVAKYISPRLRKFASLKDYKRPELKAASSKFFAPCKGVRTFFLPIFCLLMSATSAFFFACNGDPVAVPELQFPEIRELITPENAFVDPNDTLIVHARIVDPQGSSDIASVVLVATLPQNVGSFMLDMHDDGAEGDIIAGDGQFVVRFAGAQWQQAGTGEMQVRVTDFAANSTESASRSIEVKAGTRGSTPIIANLTIPDSIRVDSTYEIAVLATITDPDGSSDLDSVHYAIYGPSSPTALRTGLLQDDGQVDDGIAGNAIFGVSLTNTNISIGAGIYTLRVQAVDLSGNRSLPRTKSFMIQSALTNVPPVITSVSAPDTISRNTTGPFVLRVRVSDPNGQADIDRVFFNTFLPDDRPSSGNPFFMRDDGVVDGNGLGDITANDGEYALTIGISATNAAGIYRFEFQAQDQAGLLSEKVVHQIVVTN